jgi:hypothetical protein
LLPSLKFPIAVKVTVFPSDADEFGGVTVTLVSVAEVTVRVAVFVIEPEVAVMVVCPDASPVAKPVELMLATFEDEELQVTVLVMFRWLPSLKFPVAVNCRAVVAAMVGFVGVTVIDVREPGVTVSRVDAVTEPAPAMMVVWPAATQFATPLAEIVATAVEEELQLTEDVTFCWLPSVKVPVAVNAWVVPDAAAGFCGLS